MKSSPLHDPLRGPRLAVHRGRFREAATELTALRDQWESSGEWLLLMAMASWRLGEFSESHRLALRARTEYRTRGDADGEMRAQNVAAAGAFALGQLGTARDGFERALYLARRLESTLMMARCANNIGNVDFHLGDTAGALALYRNAAGLFEQAGSVRGTAEAWHNLGTVLREERDLPAARRAAERAVDAAEVLGEMRLVGQTLGGRGETDALLGDLPLGKATVTRALQIAREHDDRLTECESLRVLGAIARMSGDLPEAIRFGEMSVEVAEDVRNRWMLAWTTAEMAESLLAADRAEDASATFSAAASTYAEIGADIRSGRLLARVKDIHS